MRTEIRRAAHAVSIVVDHSAPAPDHDELIRRQYLIENLNIRAISRELGHFCKTIRKVLAHGTQPGYQHCQPVASPAKKSKWTGTPAGLWSMLRLRK